MYNGSGLLFALLLSQEDRNNGFNEAKYQQYIALASFSITGMPNPFGDDKVIAVCLPPVV